MPDKLTILHISTRLILGGSQENTVLSCEAQARQGHDVHLAYGPIIGPEGSMLERINRFRTDDGRHISAQLIPAMVRELSPFKDPAAYRQLRMLIGRIWPDVVHTHSSKAGVLGRFAAWKSKPRPAVVHTIHGPPFMPGDSLGVRLKNGIYTLAERAAAKRCHAVISVADAMTEQFLARGIGGPDLYTTVRSGIDLGPYRDVPADLTREAVRKKLGIAEDDMVVGTVARLAEHKGHDDILDALADDLLAHPNWKLLWVGDGWWKDKLLARATNMSLRKQIITTGLVPPDKVPGYVRAMDILCHPSYREGLPRTVNQAMLCGVPPVAYDADGTRESLIHGKTGVLIDIGDREGLRRAVADLAAKPKLRASLAAEGKAMVSREFSVGAMMNGIDAVYERALAAAKR